LGKQDKEAPLSGPPLSGPLRELLELMGQDTSKAQRQALKASAHSVATSGWAASFILAGSKTFAGSPPNPTQQLDTDLTGRFLKRIPVDSSFFRPAYRKVAGEEQQISWPSLQASFEIPQTP
jgi:hypothetical protein